jgi:hypothetical protein
MYGSGAVVNLWVLRATAEPYQANHIASLFPGSGLPVCTHSVAAGGGQVGRASLLSNGWCCVSFRESGDEWTLRKAFRGFTLSVSFIICYIKRIEDRFIFLDKTLDKLLYVEEDGSRSTPFESF